MKTTEKLESCHAQWEDLRSQKPKLWKNRFVSEYCFSFITSTNYNSTFYLRHLQTDEKSLVLLVLFSKVVEKPVHER